MGTETIIISMLQINGNLDKIENYENFQNQIIKVYGKFYQLFGGEVMTKIPLYIDNATAGSGYTPIITPIFRKYLCIKLGLPNFWDTERIIFQFAHELCHYVFYSLQGIDKPLSDTREEMICSAMSLCILKDFYDNIQRHIDYVNALEDVRYRTGGILAERLNYNSMKLANMIMSGFDTNNEVVLLDPLSL